MHAAIMHSAAKYFNMLCIQWKLVSKKHRKGNKNDAANFAWYYHS
jgi:hypothetical protein